ncbi:MAG: response regulator transcription factor [Bacteroidia bacterium]
MNKTELLIIDDEAQIRKLLEITLENNGYKVTSATCGKEGITMAATRPPDVILLDLGLPDMNGQEVLTQLRTWYNKAILILSVLDDEEEIVRALDNGATDYLTKPFRTAELLARIRSAIRHHHLPNENTIIKTFSLEINLTDRIVLKNGEAIKLTNTEYKLLVLLARNQGRVLTHHYILKEIWGTGYQEQTQYLRVFIGTLRKKIEDNPDDPKHIVTESGVGYRFS